MTGLSPAVAIAIAVALVALSASFTLVRRTKEEGRSSGEDKLERPEAEEAA